MQPNNIDLIVLIETRLVDKYRLIVLLIKCSASTGAVFNQRAGSSEVFNYKALISKFQKNFQSSSRPENLLKTFLPLNGLGRIWALGIKLMRLVKIAFNRLYIPGILAILTGWHA